MVLQRTESCLLKLTADSTVD